MGFDPTNPVQAAVFSSRDLTVTINGRPFKNSIQSISAGVSVEGMEHQYALGEAEPFAFSDGLTKPEDTVWKVHLHALQGILLAIAPDGNYLGVSFEMEVIFDKRSAPGSALLTAAASLPTTSKTLSGCRIQKVSGTWEANGSALTQEVTVKVLKYIDAGAAGIVSNLIAGAV